MDNDAKTIKAPDTDEKQRRLNRIEIDIEICRKHGYEALEKALERYKKYIER